MSIFKKNKNTEMLAQSDVKNHEALKGKIVVGTEDDFKPNTLKKNWAAFFENNAALVAPPFHSGQLTMHYRKIKKLLLPENKSQQEKRSHVFMVTSSIASEGVSTTAFNLATNFSLEREYQAIIVDACGGANSLSAQLKADALPGLMDFLENKHVLTNIIHTLPVPQLYFIPHGRLNPCRSEYFDSVHMHEFFSQIQNMCPRIFVIIDAPPSYVDPASKILSQYCDRIIFVNNILKTPQSVLKQSLQAMPMDKIAGIVASHASLFPQSLT
ncbi:hypothetical protein CC99x_009520 [Candidatus Berkiella cookevillensis]|uniref:Uncharacterized protein n=1 Tax=Candidatus Berkiella cookevillensis TaxID=437022 RepID=A0A0Q9YPH3_9GAMM|nr:hypothetical protein [Candidatus Berkiella cookevillensis]MCS5709143.1 hypothetical protein [Candidatus Berkiella cookevillensis]